MTQQEQKSFPSADQESNGRFAKGNKLGVGNPFARQVAALRVAFLSVVTEDDLREIASKLTQMAKAGDLRAARLVLQHSLGKPVPSTHPDRLNQDELQAFRSDVAPTPEELSRDLNAVPLDPLLIGVRAMRPAVGKKFREDMREGLRVMDEKDAARKSEQPATVNKRTNERPQATPGATPDSAIAETETLTLLNLTPSKRRQDDRQAANSGQQ